MVWEDPDLLPNFFIHFSWQSCCTRSPAPSFSSTGRWSSFDRDPIHLCLGIVELHGTYLWGDNRQDCLARGEFYPDGPSWCLLLCSGTHFRSHLGWTVTGVLFSLADKTTTTKKKPHAKKQKTPQHFIQTGFWQLIFLLCKELLKDGSALVIHVFLDCFLTYAYFRYHNLFNSLSKL